MYVWVDAGVGVLFSLSFDLFPSECTSLLTFPDILAHGLNPSTLHWPRVVPSYSHTQLRQNYR